MSTQLYKLSLTPFSIGTESVESVCFYEDLTTVVGLIYLKAPSFCLEERWSDESLVTAYFYVHIIW